MKCAQRGQGKRSPTQCRGPDKRGAAGWLVRLDVSLSPGRRTACTETIENGNNLVVIELMKVRIVIADRAKFRVDLETNRFVGFCPQLFQGVRRHNRRRKDEPLGLARADRPQRRARRRSCRDAVVDDNRHASLALWARPSVEVQTSSSFDFR